MGEVSISFESLFELLRREKGREELQALDKTFYEEVAAYLRFLSENQKPGTLIGMGDRQLQNAKKIVADLYEKRERKVLGLAFDSARLASSLIDKSTMLGQETLLYEGVLALLKKYREEVLARVMEGNVLDYAEIKREVAEKLEEKGLIVVEKEQEEKQPEKKKVRFLCAVEQFLDEELNTWGPFEQGSSAELPDSIIDILVNKGNAELCE